MVVIRHVFLHFAFVHLIRLENWCKNFWTYTLWKINVIRDLHTSVCYRQLCRRAALPVFRLLTGRFWGFSPRRGDTLHRSRSNLAGRNVRSSLPNLTLIGSGLGVYGPKTEKNSNFPNIIAPKGRAPCTIFTKFAGYMRVLSLYHAAEFGCFISINDKIINNLLRWGDFSQIFDAP